jgi:hypothetical protein
MTPASVYTKPIRNKYIQNPRWQKNLCLLHVCSESRTAALKRYKKVSDIYKTYVNFSLDTVCIDFIDYYNLTSSYPIRPSENEAQIQFLAVDVKWFYFAGVEDLMRKFGRCKTLRELTFVVKFNTEITKECEAKLLTRLAKFEAEDLIYSDLEKIDMDFLWLNFSDLCDVLSMIWVLGSREFSISKDRWPEMAVVARPCVKLEYNISK